MSRAPFTRSFLRETGATFNDFVTEQRLVEARRLLRDTDWSVEVVAEFVGLSSSRLRMLFQHREKCTPTAFRRRFRST
jgi:two-component system response regulator YesN